MTAALEGGECSAARPGRTLPPEKTRYPFYRRLGGPQGRSGRAENIIPTGIRSRTVQPVVSRYTDWATRPTFILCTYLFLKNKWSIVHDPNTCNWTTLPSSVMYACIYFFNHLFTLSRKDAFNISFSAVSSDRMVNCTMNCGLSGSAMSSHTLRYYLLIHKETSAQVIS